MSIWSRSFAAKRTAGESVAIRGFNEAVQQMGVRRFSLVEQGFAGVHNALDTTVHLKMRAAHAHAVALSRLRREL